MTNIFCYGIISAIQIFNLWKSNVVKLVEILVLGQVLRLNVPIEQEELLRQAARNFRYIGFRNERKDRPYSA